MRIIRPLFTGIFYFCVATIIAQLILGGVLWLKGGFSGNKRLRILAVLYDVDPQAIRLDLDKEMAASSKDAGKSPGNSSQNAPLGDRDASFRNALGDLVALQNLIRNEQDRHEILKQDFDNLLAQLEAEATENSLAEVRRTLEILPPKQAKTQILRMLSEGAIEDVARIVNAMPLSSRGKILKEFKSRDEERERHRIMEELSRQAGAADTAAAGDAETP